MLRNFPFENRMTWEGDNARSMFCRKEVRRSQPVDNKTHSERVETVGTECGAETSQFPLDLRRVRQHVQLVKAKATDVDVEEHLTLLDVRRISRARAATEKPESLHLTLAQPRPIPPLEKIGELLQFAEEVD